MDREGLEWHADEVRRGRAERPVHRRVRVEDAACSVEGKDAIVGALQDTLELAPLGPQLGFCRFSARDLGLQRSTALLQRQRPSAVGDRRTEGEGEQDGAHDPSGS